MSASRVAEMREDWARRANERRAHKRGANEHRAHKRGANERGANKRGANERGQARSGVGPRSATARDARAERPSASGGRAAGAVGDTAKMPSSSETIPMVFRGVYGVFAPLHPQPTDEPPGTIRVITEFKLEGWRMVLRIDSVRASPRNVIGKISECMTGGQNTRLRSSSPEFGQGAGYSEARGG